MKTVKDKYLVVGADFAGGIRSTIDGRRGSLKVRESLDVQMINIAKRAAELITMCSMLRILVCMHNVSEDDIYRPAAWNAFGMDKEGQDYRACQAYGSLYKTIK